MSDIKIYYMRDNHTFRSISLNVEKALEQIKEEIDAGYSYGMVCSKFPKAPAPIHAKGIKSWTCFKEQVRKFYKEIFINNEN